MSRDDWQTGSVLLPAAVVPAVRNALVQATNKQHDLARGAAQVFWEKHAKKTRSATIYAERLREYLYGDQSYRIYNSHGDRTHISGLVTTAQLFELGEALKMSAPHKLTLVELTRWFPKATNRTTRFSNEDMEVVLVGRKLTWSIHYGVAKATAEPIMQAMFHALGRVAWTRGSGGHSWGSDEYTMEAAREHGGPAVYIADRWGPRGAQARV